MSLLVLAMAVSAASQPAPATPVIDPFRSSSKCPDTPMSLARKNGTKPLGATPLNQLPKGQVFMAVDRRVDGCSVPLTAAEYRKARASQR